jgi:hypothetical protein
MQSWVRRTVALAALAGAGGLLLLAHGVRGEAQRLLAPFHGAGIVAIAGVAAVGCIGLDLLLVLSPAGHGRRKDDQSEGTGLSGAR